MSTQDPQRLRKKQIVLDSLAKLLTSEMSRYEIDPRCTKIIAEILQAEADQLRLMLGGGTVSETFRTEWKIYEVLCPSASLAHRFFKMLSLTPSLLIPPKTYYEWRVSVVGNSTYRRARELLLRNPPRMHVENAWKPKSSLRRLPHRLLWSGAPENARSHGHLHPPTP